MQLASIASSTVGHTDQQSSLAAAHTVILGHFRNEAVVIYEAGGGSDCFLPLQELRVKQLVTVDVDARQLEMNNYCDVKIRGDIQSCRFVPGTFDLVVCYNVIEHLDRPDCAITLFHEALAPGGLLFIAAPDPWSLTGLATKLTPHALHVAYYKHLHGWKDAGQPGCAPFKTVYHPIVGPKKLKALCRALGFKIDYFSGYRSSHYAALDQSHPLLGKVLKASTHFANAISLNARDFGKGDYHMVARKEGEWRPR